MSSAAATQQITRPSPLYLVETFSPRSGMRWFIEVDRDSNSRDFVVGLIRSGEVEPVTVLEIDEVEGTTRNVTSDVIAEALDQRGGSVMAFHQIHGVRIRTNFDYPPIPARTMDWSAVDDDTYDCDCDQDGFFSHNHVGHGATEQDAIEDLLEQLEVA